MDDPRQCKGLGAGRSPELVDGALLDADVREAPTSYSDERVT